jgi:serine O-acetyltransferase
MPQEMPDIDPVQYAMDHMLDDINNIDQKIQMICATLKKIGGETISSELESCQIRYLSSNKIGQDE